MDEPEPPATTAPAEPPAPALPGLPPSSLPHAEMGRPMVTASANDRRARPPDFIYWLVSPARTPCNRYRHFASPRDFSRDERRATRPRMVRVRVAGVLVFVGCCVAFACNRPATSNGADSNPSASPPAIAGAPAVTSPTASAPSRCAEICEHVRPLRCSSEPQCLSQCKEMSGAAVCHAEMLGVLSCMAGEPATSFECDAEVGAAALREGVCGAEQARFAACYDARSGKP